VRRVRAISFPLRKGKMITRCLCTHCSNGIEFESDDLSEENCLINCPHCGLETQLFIPKKYADNPNAPDMESQRAEVMERLKEVANSRIIYSNLDSLKLNKDIVSIHKRGLANALASGINGERSIQVSSLAAIQMKPAGIFTMGYILFSYAGSKPFNGGLWEATQDPDAFLFGQPLNDQIAEFKSFVETRMRELRHSKPMQTQTTLTEELRRLIEFKNQGVLSEIEFESAKKKLLS
jgi:hypothetical protein